MPVKLLRVLENARRANEELWLKYNARSIECYQTGDNVGRDYWNERAYHIICENELIDMDIRKVKESVNKNVN